VQHDVVEPGAVCLQGRPVEVEGPGHVLAGGEIGEVDGGGAEVAVEPGLGVGAGLAAFFGEGGFFSMPG
jgi:hypothetical protein